MRRWGWEGKREEIRSKDYWLANVEKKGSFFFLVGG